MDTYTQPVTPKRQYRSSGREAADCGRDIGRGSIGGAGGASARSQRQSGLQLVQAVSSGATGTAERGQTVAGASNCGEMRSTAASCPEPGASLASRAGTIHIQLQHAQVRVEGGADPVLLRVLLECLQR